MPNQQPTTNNQQLVFVVGPTATGKTKLALELVEKLHADILSADSRQVYQGLEITTGADVPHNFVRIADGPGQYQYFSNGNMNFYGINFLKPTQEWSIAHFRDLAEQVWEKTQLKNRTLVIVGGSGLYHHSLFLDKASLHIQPSDTLREKFENSSAEELQQQLLSQFPGAQKQLNNSDWQNPRRLLRWIEKTTEKPHSDAVATPSIFGIETQHLWIGLYLDKTELENKIRQRVITRIETGAIAEVERLLSLQDEQKLPSFSTLGVKDITLFLNDKISKEEMIELWTRHEIQYSKRQLTWFKKRKYIKWFDTDKIFTSQQIDDIVREVEVF